MLHGATAFHLGVRFGRDVLGCMIAFLEERGEKRILSEALIGKSDHHLKWTPLHCAALRANPQAMRYTIQNQWNDNGESKTLPH